MILTFQFLILLSSRASSSFVPTPASTPAAVIEVRYERGLPVLQVPLPSRAEPCQFSLRPLSDTVGSFCNNLHDEDKGIDYAAIYNPEGIRIAASTSVEHLLQFGNFRLRLNDLYYDVEVPKHAYAIETSSETVRTSDDLRATVASLHAALNVDEWKLARERDLIKRLEQAELELRPLEVAKEEIAVECEKHSERVMWVLFSFMGIQTGIFARLTWWEYSWDIMEPVTYFATYSSVLGSMAYYLYTKQSFDYPIAKSRVFTKQFYIRAEKRGFDVGVYNKLVDEVEELRAQLKRLRDPLFQHLPVSYLSRLEKDRQI